MKFRIETTRNRFSKEKVENLMELGFEFMFDMDMCYPYKKIYKKNSYISNVLIEIESIEQLIELGNKVDCDLIIDSKNMIIFIDDE